MARSTLLENTTPVKLLQAYKNRKSQQVSSSKFAIVTRCNANIDGKILNFYVKEYLCRSLPDFVKHLFKKSRARRAFNAGLMLEENGFDTPRILALAQFRKLGLCLKNILITEEIADTEPAYIALKKQKDKKQLIIEMGRIVGKMHLLNIFHGDLRMGNILVKKERDNFHFYLIDNERTKQFGRIPDNLRIKNLVQLNMMLEPGLTKTDRFRFYKQYCKECFGDLNIELLDFVIRKTRKRLSKLVSAGRINQSDLWL